MLYRINKEIQRSFFKLLKLIFNKFDTSLLREFNEFIRIKTSGEQRYQKLKNVRVIPGSFIDDNTNIGKYSYIGPNCVIYKTNIGKFTSIGPEVHINPISHPTNFLSTHDFQYASNDGYFKNLVGLKNSQFQPSMNVNIGNDCWIGTRSIIMGDVTIGDGAIIGANAVVTKDVPPYAIVVGTPAKIIRYRFSEDIIEDLLNIKWWDLNEEQLRSLPFDNIKECISILKSRIG